MQSPKEFLTEKLDSEVYNDVAAEQLRQIQKWGVQNHNPYKWLAILGEEVGEANKATLENDRFINQQDLREELIQVAAVAISFIECIDRRGWV